MEEGGCACGGNMVQLRSEIPSSSWAQSYPNMDIPCLMSVFPSHSQMPSSMRAGGRGLIWKDMPSFPDIMNLGKTGYFSWELFPSSLNMSFYHGSLSDASKCAKGARRGETRNNTQRILSPGKKKHYVTSTTLKVQLESWAGRSGSFLVADGHPA